MQLSRIHLTQFRKFRGEVELRDLAPGLNVFTGANEAGKSTLVNAIRAAFLERHRSKAAEDFRPSGDSHATPAIRLEFALRGEQYQLFKQFLARQRCTLTFGAQQLDGDEAEDYLAKLFGYQYANKGRSKADHWGIPGLLWTQQGQTPTLDSAIAYAVEHIRMALGASSAHPLEDTNQLVQAVARERNALLTLKNNEPRGVYATALTRVQDLTTQYQETQVALQRYRQAVDQLSTLRATHAKEEIAQPWQAIRAKQAQAQAQLAQAAQLQQDWQRCLTRQQELSSTVKILQNQLQQLDAQTKTLAQRRAAVEKAQQTWQDAQAEAERWQQRHAQAQLAQQRAQQTLQHCQALAQRRAIQQEQQRCVAQLEEAQHKLAQANQAHEALQDLQTQWVDLRVDAQALSRLRSLDRDRRAHQIQQQAQATQLHFALEPSATLTLDGQVLHGTGTRQLTAAATVHIPGTGTLQIQPGGEGLQDLHHKQVALDAAWTALLRQMGAATLEEIEARNAQAAHVQADVNLQQKTLQLHAPQGVDALRRSITTLQAELRALDAQLSAHAQPFIAEHAPSVIDLAQAQAQAQTAQTAAEAARDARHQAQLAVGTAEAQHAHAQHEWQAAQIAMTQHAQRVDDCQRQLIDANAALVQVKGQAETLKSQVTQARPDILAQDVQRYERSAQALQYTHQQRHETLLRLETELQTLGAHGLDERAATQTLALTQAQHHADELTRRARALDHLLQLLREHEHAATQALQAPLQPRLRHYLDLLFPGAELNLTEQLTPNTLRRSDLDGQRLELLETLSHGAREQLGLIGRLAYADLLRDAGRPTLILLDDALVHTDAQRLAQMKRILFDAATRHQILLFSCHDTLWHDMGVVPRDMSALHGCIV